MGLLEVIGPPGGDLVMGLVPLERDEREHSLLPVKTQQEDGPMQAGKTTLTRN